MLTLYRRFGYEQIRVLCPEYGYRPTDLNKRAEHGFIVEWDIRTIDYLLGFHKVGDIALVVYASSQVANARIVSRPPRYQNKLKLLCLVLQIYRVIEQNYSSYSESHGSLAISTSYSISFSKSRGLKRNSKRIFHPMNIDPSFFAFR